MPLFTKTSTNLNKYPVEQGFWRVENDRKVKGGGGFIQKTSKLSDNFVGL